MIGVMLVTAVVDSLLLLAAGLLQGGGIRYGRAILGGLISGVLAQGAIMGKLLWRIAGMWMGVIVASGLSWDTIGKGFIFMGLQIFVFALIKGHWMGMTLGFIGILSLCILSGRGADLIPVELSYMGKTLHITALRDTGNQLRDPITGRQVLIVGADIAGKLTGLSPAALEDPVNTMGAIPGLRLIPYRTVGNTGFLLALKLSDVRIGNRQGQTVVAFSPLVLGSKYQALTGGLV